ncbi:hypothetical protein CCOS865_00489 [Pseudomonas reidholzensis]|uniref:CBM-cenC domain-containing protein n=1 Tax=Pseudomonas reidholzensis TaxID=1785162 RepID=A0A383RMY8_9PSED|nr:hypothetical protein [Pseudomonas reidholzensis]SYX88265.1 hypothetical protein CCOS865_00489 [Pseudomonas reidholzensis]
MTQFAEHTSFEGSEMNGWALVAPLLGAKHANNVLSFPTHAGDNKKTLVQKTYTKLTANHRYSFTIRARRTTNVKAYAVLALYANDVCISAALELKNREWVSLQGHFVHEGPLTLSVRNRVEGSGGNDFELDDFIVALEDDGNR